MNPALPAHTTISPVGNDAILQRLDREHLAALEKFTALFEADGEADESPETKLADLECDAIGSTAAHFPATSLEGLTSKTRILARQGRAMTAGEIVFRAGEIRQRLAVALLQDMLDYAGDYMLPAAAPQLRIAAE